MQGSIQVNERYQAALERVAARLEEDYYVLAAVLYGSVARGEAWERSDIDLVVILRDGQERENRMQAFTEDDISVSAHIVTRNHFKRELEGSLQGSFNHSIRSQFKILFSKDESIDGWLKESSHVDSHDQAMQLLISVSPVPYYLDKAEKWYTAKHDLDYCFLWLLFAVSTLAKVEVVLNNEAPGREALDQALKLNPDFFRANYTDLIHGPKTAEAIGAALRQVDGYLEQHADRLFTPVLDYLSEAEGPVTISDLDAHFKKKAPDTMLFAIYDWLARKGIIHRLSSPVRLTRKSTVTLEEPAYYFEKDDATDWE
jgi:uncharacterized protein